MATTWIKPIHKSKKRSVAGTLADAIGYADNPDKSGGYEYVKSYGCDYFTAANEFALSKQIYENQTGRGGRNGDIIAFHLRQSFKPGEITPQEALEIGYALAEKFTHGNHQFVVAVHTDKRHIHCHCIFNAVNMDCSGKFRNPIGSMKIVRRISDYLCAERGLSIVENPEKSKGSYRDWQDKKEPARNRDKLQEMIDSHISAGMLFEQFIAAMHEAGCEVKRGKYLAFKLPGAERFIRVKSIGEDYTEQALRERCVGKRPAPKRSDSEIGAERKGAAYAASLNKSKAPSLLIDIQAKIREGASDGYVQWMKIFNLKTAARTLIFLQEHGIDSYDELRKKSDAASSEFHRLSSRLKEVETRQQDIAELQKQIGTYGKTRNTYAIYKKSGWDKDYNDANATDIILHRAAKKYFDAQGFKGKLPSINQLKQEWAALEAERRKLSPGYRTAKENYVSLCTSRANADVLLFGSRQPQKSRDRDAR
jgi:hypothetical protein